MALLSVMAIVVRLHTWSSEHALVSVTAPDELYWIKPTLESLPNLDETYATVVVPEFDMPVVNTVAKTQKQKPVRFMKVNKEVNILDEVFSAPDMGEIENVEGEWRQLHGATTIKTEELVVLKPVVIEEVSSTSFVALMDTLELPVEERTEVARAPAIEPVVAEVEKTDVVSTVMAKDTRTFDEADAEPEFIEIAKPSPETVVKPFDAQVAKAAATVQKDEYSVPVGWDLPVGSQKAIEKTDIKVDEKLVTYGYVAPAGKLPKTIRSPAVAVAQVPRVSTQGNGYSPKPNKIINNLRKPEPVEETEKGMTTLASRVTIAPLSFGAGKTATQLKNFEVRSKDDDAEFWQDQGTGKVIWEESVAAGTYSRGIVILQPDHVPTHADIVLAQGQEGVLEIPVITNEKLQALGEVARQVPTGNVLIELDENTEEVQIDGIKTEAKKLTADLMITTGEDYRYLFFPGVEAGNRTVTLVRTDGRVLHHIIHVHEKEVSFDPNLYSEEERLTVRLVEEDLLSKKKRSLVIPSDSALLFFSGEKAQKLTPSTYAYKKSPMPLGARHYMVLTHQGEEVYVGTSEAKTVEVPSEALMREVIRRFKLSGNSKSCVVQVNLEKPAKRYQVLAESYGEGHVSYGLALDEDGQFYESMGEGSKKLFFMSENQSGSKYSDNARLNIRIEYQDGSHRSFSSYCSPNSYMVEQL